MTSLLEEHDPDILMDEAQIEDEDELEEPVPNLRYDITSYGIDFDVEGLVRRLNRDEILIPEWQRAYVWSHRQASSFVESLLLGLPVPGVFLARDYDSGKFFVIDGQQRLKTLQYFYLGKRPDLSPESTSVFKLQGVQDRFSGLTYESLGPRDQIDLDNSLIHATVVRQESPPDSDTSMYHMFQRLNSGGRPVNPQEIRRAIYHGGLMDKIEALNEYPDWRAILGKPNRRLKDQEMILRFMAMWHDGDKYTESMAEFLNVFTQNNRNPCESWLDDTSDMFKQVVSAFAGSKGRESFRLSEGRAANAAVFDSMSVGLAKWISQNGEASPELVIDIHDSLIKREEYLQSVERRAYTKVAVARRLQLVADAFANA